jgi:hypothetical protein
LPSRMSRAQWLAFGSTLAIVGCGDRTGATTSDSVRVARPQGVTPDDVTADGATADGATVDGAMPEGSVARRAGDTFPCDTSPGTVTCHVATEYCRSGSPSCGTSGCVPVPAACIATPSCDCLYDAGLSYSTDCEDDAGTIEVYCPCYGAPPRRLERVGRAGRWSDA